MTTPRIDIVLVRPARPANVAAACRAMKNMGLARLRLVEPPEGLRDADARALAYGAWELLDGAKVAPTLREAVAESTFIVGTSGRPAPETWSPRHLAAELPGRAGRGSTAIVFGPESTGLRKDELALCHVRVHIPTAPEHSSLNLAQAVLVLGYEIFLASASESAREPGPGTLATSGEIEAALGSLGEGLLGIGFLNKDNPAALLAELRRWVARSAPTPREVTLLRGVGRQIAWAAREIAR
ncbi:MAG: TrmJ/YjtD family RNA methyltransferase, partial [Thermoplasmata archaeon]|nr:TrmJ/YjtD family RNA methyltransferase [Thermoplasmata archaeon]